MRSPRLRKRHQVRTEAVSVAFAMHVLVVFLHDGFCEEALLAQTAATSASTNARRAAREKADPAAERPPARRPKDTDSWKKPKGKGGGKAADAAASGREP